MNLEVTVTRGDLNLVRYNDELMRVLEDPLDAGKGATFTAWQRFRAAHKSMMEAVEGLTESLDPFTLTLRVEGKKKQAPPPGTWQLYSSGTTSGQLESEPSQAGERPQA